MGSVTATDNGSHDAIKRAPACRSPPYGPVSEVSETADDLHENRQRSPVSEVSEVSENPISINNFSPLQSYTPSDYQSRQRARARDRDKKTTDITDTTDEHNSEPASPVADRLAWKTARTTPPPARKKFGPNRGAVAADRQPLAGARARRFADGVTANSE
jgi:hypothetical protein